MNTRLGKLLKKEFGNNLKYIWIEPDYLEKYLFIVRILIDGEYCEYVISNRKVSSINGRSCMYYIDKINKVLNEL